MQRLGMIDNTASIGIIKALTSLGLDAASKASPKAKIASWIFKGVTTGRGILGGNTQVDMNRVLEDGDIGSFASFLNLEALIVTNGTGELAFTFTETPATQAQVDEFNRRLQNAITAQGGNGRMCIEGLIGAYGRNGGIGGAISALDLFQQGVIPEENVELTLADIERNFSFWAFVEGQLNVKTCPS